MKTLAEKKRERKRKFLYYSLDTIGGIGRKERVSWLKLWLCAGWFLTRWGFSFTDGWQFLAWHTEFYFNHLKTRRIFLKFYSVNAKFKFFVEDCTAVYKTENDLDSAVAVKYITNSGSLNAFSCKINIFECLDRFIQVTSILNIQLNFIDSWNMCRSGSIRHISGVTTLPQETDLTLD